MALSDTSVAARAPRLGSALAVVALLMAQEETEWFLRRRHTMAGNGCRTLTPFCRWKDYSIDDGRMTVVWPATVVTHTRTPPL